MVEGELQEIFTEQGMWNRVDEGNQRIKAQLDHKTTTAILLDHKNQLVDFGTQACKSYVRKKENHNLLSHPPPSPLPQLPHTQKDTMKNPHINKESHHHHLIFAKTTMY